VSEGLAHLVDIQNGEWERNRGIGTATLAFAEGIFRDLGAHVVSGALSPLDLPHRARQVHFYEKNDYAVELSDDGGYVEKKLA